ncbi:MAG: histidine phosphatase family protein [Actinomycetota bacterium]|nr:histidine phosphatase family protein [Actinomycetota bacterium]
MTPAPRRVVVLRHGQTAFNREGRVQGQLDVPLDDAGREQAAGAARHLSGVPGSAVASDLSRAWETAHIVAGDLGVRADPRLRELDLGTWQGLTTAEIQQRWPGEYEAWQHGADVARGGGETYADAGARSAECIREALLAVPAGATLLAVTHGGTARAALGVLLELDPKSWWVLAPLGNAAWSVLVEGERGWRLERHNISPGPLVGPGVGAHDLGARPAEEGPAGEPVK